MCSGIEHEDQLHLWKDPDVRLPVLCRDGSVEWLLWGQRHGVPGDFVQGPCARLESVREGRWNRYAPRPVKIPLTRFMERDQRNRPCWVAVAPDQCLQGLIAHHGDDRRIYVVTVDAPPDSPHGQPRQPRLIPRG